MTAIRKVLPLILLLAALPAQAGTWISIDVPGAESTQALGINSAGDVVGAYTNAGGGLHGFVLHDGEYASIDAPDAQGTGTFGINDNGQISGWFGTRDGSAHGFLLQGQSFTILTYPGAIYTEAFGIDNAGEIVGFYSLTKRKSHGFKWSNGVFVTRDAPNARYTTAYGISNRGQVVGVYGNANSNPHAFLMNAQGKFHTFTFKTNTLGVTGVNDHKIVVGTTASSNSGFRFNVRTKAFRKMRFPGEDQTSCVGINNSGQIVGFYGKRGTYRYHGFLWTP